MDSKGRHLFSWRSVAEKTRCGFMLTCSTATLNELNVRPAIDFTTSGAEELSDFQTCEKSLQTVLKACIAPEVKDRPSSLVIIQAARDHICMLPNKRNWRLHPGGPAQSYKYPLEALLECLENLFYCLSTELDHGIGWIPRFWSLWDDIGSQSGREILWSDNECAYLKILLKRPNRENSDKPENFSEDLWEPRSNQLEGEAVLSGCRWNTQKFSAPDLRNFLARKFVIEPLAHSET